MFSAMARYSRASSWARGVSSFVSIASVMLTHVASPVPATPVPTTVRCRPRMIRASIPFGSRPMSSIWATVPTVA